MLEKLGDSLSDVEGDVSGKVDDSEAMSKSMVSESYKTLRNEAQMEGGPEILRLAALCYEDC